MAEQVVLDASPRTVMGKASRHLRREGLLPANIYGHKQTPTPIQIDAMLFDRLRREHGTRNIITLRFADAPSQMALVKHVQRDAVTGHVLHIDFTRVDVRERLDVKIPLHFVGEAPGVKIQGGVFLPLMDSLAVACEAADMAEHIDVDITSLTDLDSVLHAGEVKLPGNYDLVTDPDEPIVKIDPPRVEVPAVAPSAVTTPAVTESAEAEGENQ